MILNEIVFNCRVFGQIFFYEGALGSPLRVGPALEWPASEGYHMHSRILSVDDNAVHLRLIEESLIGEEFSGRLEPERARRRTHRSLDQA